MSTCATDIIHTTTITITIITMNITMIMIRTVFRAIAAVLAPTPIANMAVSRTNNPRRRKPDGGGITVIS